MNLQQQDRFYEMMTRLRSRAASSSSQSKDDVTITEITDGLIVSRPAKKYQEIRNTSVTKTTSEPEIIDLQENTTKKSKAGSVSVNGINNLKVIRDFIRSNGRL